VVGCLFLLWNSAFGQAISVSREQTVSSPSLFAPARECLDQLAVTTLNTVDFVRPMTSAIALRLLPHREKAGAC